MQRQQHRALHRIRTGACVPTPGTRQQQPAERVGYLKNLRTTLVTDIDPLIAIAATVAIAATTLLVAHL